MQEERYWYLFTANGHQGPYTASELRQFLADGSITPEWNVWRDGWAQWQPIGATPELETPPMPGASESAIGNPVAVEPTPAPAFPENPDQPASAPARVPASAPPSRPEKPAGSRRKRWLATALVLGSVLIVVATTILLIRKYRQPAIAPGESVSIGATYNREQLRRIGVTQNLDDSQFQQMLAAIVVVKSGSTTGSGVVVSPDGLVLTNRHVVAGGSQLTIILTDRQDGVNEKVTFNRITSIKVHPDLDLALVQVQTRGRRLPAVRLATASPDLGDPVLVIGNPGVGDGTVLEQTVSEGIISGPTREINGQDYLQTSAPVNRGNSGGGLFDHTGFLAGIVTAKLANAEGIALALPVTDEVLTEITADPATFVATGPDAPDGPRASGRTWSEDDNLDVGGPEERIEEGAILTDVITLGLKPGRIQTVPGSDYVYFTDPSNSRLRRLDPGSGRLANFSVPFQPMHLTYLDGFLIISAQESNQLYLFKIEDRKVVKQIGIPEGIISAIVALPGQEYLYVATTSEAVYAIDFRSLVVTKTDAVGFDLAVSPDEQFLFTASETLQRNAVVERGNTLQFDQWAEGSGIARYLVRSGTLVRQESALSIGAAGQRPNPLYLSPDGKRIHLASRGGYRPAGGGGGYVIPALNAASLSQVLGTFETDAFPRQVFYHPQRRLAFCPHAGRQSPFIHVFDRVTFRRLGQIEIDPDIWERIVKTEKNFSTSADVYGGLSQDGKYIFFWLIGDYFPEPNSKSYIFWGPVP